MKKNIPDITGMNVIDMLAFVFGDGQLPDHSPDGKIGDGQKAQFTVKSAMAKRFYSAKTIFESRLKEIGCEHRRLHIEGIQEEHDCQQFASAAIRLDSNKDLLVHLMWQALAEENHSVAANSCGLKEGWVIVNVKKDNQRWESIDATSGKTSVANNFIDRISAIVKSDASHEELEIVATPVGKDEVVIGSLNDRRIQRLFALTVEIEQEIHSHLPAGLDDGMDSIGEMTLNELNRLQVLSFQLRGLCELTRTLFWSGVRESIPDAKDVASIGIRRDWDVVECPSKGEDSRSGMGTLGQIIGASGLPMDGELLEVVQALKALEALESLSKLAR